MPVPDTKSPKPTYGLDPETYRLMMDKLDRLDAAAATIGTALARIRQLCVDAPGDGNPKEFAGEILAVLDGMAT